MYITIYEIGHQSKSDAWNRALEAGELEQPWGMDGEGVGKGVQDGRHMHTRGWFMSMYGKNHYNFVK